MKRLILITLLFLIPFQFAWAVAGTYCQHEGDQGSMHFGHHAHQHDGKKDASDAKAKIGKFDSDCASCHGLSTISGNGVRPAIVPLGIDSPVPRARFYISHIPDGPRRPDRFPVA